MKRSNLTRREFINFASLSLGGLTIGSLKPQYQLPEFPASEKLGRICYGMWDLKARPDYDSQTVGRVFDDQVVTWLREVTGRWPYRNNQRWVETPDGYLWGAYLQPVRNLPNQPVNELPQTGSGTGMWVEVSVPFVDLSPLNTPPHHPYFKNRYENGFPLRYYYSQILWVDQTRVETDGSVRYRVNEKYGNRGDIFWADARAFRPLPNEELSTISPDVTEKRIIVDITTQRQYLMCYEGNKEVYFCRISSGKKAGSTPIGSFKIFNKFISLHMEGGTAVEGWDTNGVGWSSLFAQGGVAIHSTYWHNNYGEEESNGCVNVSPEDAKWIFRWTTPSVNPDPGNTTVSDFSGTTVEVVQV